MLFQVYKLAAFVFAAYLILSPTNNSLGDVINVVIFIMRDSYKDPSGLSITFNNNAGHKVDCFVPEVYAMHWQVRVLSGKTVLAWLDELNEEGQREGRFFLVKVKNCDHQMIYRGIMSDEYQIFTDNNASDERFTLMMHGKEYCYGHDWCRLHFNPSYEKFQSFDLDFPLDQIDEIYPAMSFNPNLFVVRHTDDINTHRIRLYDLSTKNITIHRYKELLSIPNYVSFVNNARLPNFELASSGLSVCWRKLTHDNKTIYCIEFGENGTLVDSRRIAYPDLPIPWDVKVVPSRLIITMVFECFKNKDFLRFPATIENVSMIIEHLNTIREYLGEYRWDKFLDVNFPRPQSNTLVYMESEADSHVFKRIRRSRLDI